MSAEPTTDWYRRSILATLDETMAAERALGIPHDPYDIAEIRAIIARIERRIGQPAAEHGAGGAAQA